jgi:hypothetical protein
MNAVAAALAVVDGERVPSKIVSSRGSPVSLDSPCRLRAAAAGRASLHLKRDRLLSAVRV